MRTTNKSDDKFLKELTREIEMFWDPGVYVAWYVLEHPDETITMVHDKLREEGFPKEASSVTTDWSIRVKSNKSPEDWAQLIDQRYPELRIENEEGNTRAISDFFSKYKDFELRASSGKDMTYIVELEMDAQEWIDQFVPFDTLVERLKKHWPEDRQDVAEILQMDWSEYDVAQEIVIDTAKEHFGEQMTIEEIKRFPPVFSIDTIVEHEEWAEQMYARSTVEDRKKFSEGDAEEYYLQYPNQLIYHVHFELTPEEYAEQYRD